MRSRRRQAVTRGTDVPQKGRPACTLVVVSPSGGKGGAETMLLRAVAASRARGWRVRCLVPSGPLHDTLRDSGADVQHIPALGLDASSRLVAYLRLLSSLARAAARVRTATRGADIVLANGLLTLPAVICSPRAVARVWWAHDVLVREDRLLLARWCSRRLDVVVGVSQAVLDPLSHLPVRTALVRNGVDRQVDEGDEVRKAPEPPPYVIGCNAALTPWKGQDVLLEALALLRRPEVRLELLGAALPKDAAYEARLRGRADEKDLRGRVRFLGHVADPLEVMRRWHVGVSASVDPEASGLGVLEGMSLGIPQVATAHGGPQEVLDGAGLLVPPRDAPQMAHALARLLDDEQLWSACSRSGPSTVVRHLHRPAQEAAFVEVLAAAVRGSCR